MRCISWNVNGLRACRTKGFDEVFRGMDADFFCIQESKLQEGQTDFAPEGWYACWNYADKKGYSGTAVFARKEPGRVFYGIGVEEHDHEGRVITLEYPDFYFVTVYTPNSQNELKRLAYRMKWEDDFRNYLCRLDSEKPVIVCGDMNVAHSEIDLKNPSTNHKNAGFTDTFRCLYPETILYSWWSYRFRAREKNAGWRIDYFLVSDRLMSRVKDALIYTDIMGSDHCPVGLELEVTV